MKRPELMITNGELAGRRFSVGDGGLRLGRSSSNDIHIPDEELSRNHCLFETVGADGLRVTDLASANGTYLNGKALGGDPTPLKVGDLVEVGSTVIRVVGEAAETSPGQVDLGLGSAPARKPDAKRRSPLANALWAVAVLALGAAIYVVLVLPQGEPEAKPVVLTEQEPVLTEASYEKVAADSKGIFRYAMTLKPDGRLSVAVDDLRQENRHMAKEAQLGEGPLAELRDILSWKALHEIDREYVGVEPDPPSLDSRILKVVYTTRTRTIKVVNMQEPETFRTVREKLEAFVNNELGIWALQYSREKLVSLAEESIELGKSKWNDRDVQYGNLHGAVAAFRAAIAYLETVNPKPDCIGDARRGLEESQTELDRRYRDQRFLADQAIKLSQWDAAQRELTVLTEMIPDRNDDRNREAMAKLVDVEKRLKGGKK